MISNVNCSVPCFSNIYFLTLHTALLILHQNPYVKTRFEMDLPATEHNAETLALCSALDLPAPTTADLVRYHDLYHATAPESTPFVHRYAARDLLLSLRSSLVSDAHRRSNTLLGIIALRLAVNYKETEETGAALQWFTEALSLLDHAFWTSTLRDSLKERLKKEEKGEIPGLIRVEEEEPERIKKDSRNIDIDIVQEERARTYYEFAALLCQWEEFEPASIALKRGKELLGPRKPPHTESFRQKVADITFLEAQVHLALGNREKATQDCIETLRLKRALPKAYVPEEWIKEALALAALLLAQKDFKAAWHCLQAANRALESCAPPTEMDCLTADVNMAIGRFCKALLDESEGQVEGGVQRFDLDGRRAEDEEIEMNIHSFEVAREAFKLGFKHLELAKEVYVLDGFVTQNVEILRGEFGLYVCLATYEENAKRKVSMLRRAVAIEGPLLEQLNPKIYHREHVELSLELARVAQDIAQIQDERWQAGELKGNAKFNKASKEAIRLFQHFIDCFDEKKESFINDMKEDLNLVEAYISAHFNIAKLCSNMKFTQSSADKLDYYKKAFRLHEKAVKLRGLLVPHDSNLLKEEAEYSKQIVELLAETISRMHFAASTVS